MWCHKYFNVLIHAKDEKASLNKQSVKFISFFRITEAGFKLETLKEIQMNFGKFLYSSRYEDMEIKE